MIIKLMIAMKQNPGTKVKRLKVKSCPFCENGRRT